MAAASGKGVAVTVLGATEQHGPHLPLGTDTWIGEALLERALAHVSVDTTVVVMPTLSMGVSDEHADFAGTLSLSSEAFGEQLMAQAASLANVGLHRWVWVNTHGGNVGIMDSVAIEVRHAFDVWVAKAYYPKFEPMPKGPSAQELSEGLHGGQVETSMMLAIAPELVDLSQMQDFKLERPPKVGQAPLAWLAQDLHPQGVVGRANLANPKEGEALLTHYGCAIAEAIDALSAHPIP